MKKIAFLTSYIATPHLETELELMQLHIDSGDKVYQVVCDGNLSVCLGNAENVKQTCLECISKRNKGTNLISGRVNKINIFNQPEKYDLSFLPNEFISIEALKEYRIDNFDAGMSVVSSLVSYAKTPYLNIKDNQDYIKRSLEAATYTYFATRDFLKENKFDMFYIFNGRFSIEKAALRACEFHNQVFSTHERGCDKGHYEVFENVLPHNISYNHSKMLEYWEKETDLAKRRQEAVTFFESKRDNVWKSWTPFLNSQKNAELPANWDKTKYNIVVFTTSDNEFVAIGDEWKQFVFDSQLEGIQEIAETLRSIGNKSIQLYVRLHPNLSNYEPEHEFTINALAQFSDVLHVVDAYSSNSSYAILLNCDKVITFGSTMGMEATYFEKPSISLSSSFYQYLDVVYQPNNKEEAMNLILDMALIPKSKEKALIGSFYLQTFGVKYNYYKPITLFSGKFCGLNLLETRSKAFLLFHSFKQEIKKIINKIIGREKFEIYEV